MGIPSYFSYIIRNHMNILKKFSIQTHQFQHLYFDSNSIIYDSIREIEKAGKMKPVLSENYENISAMVCSKLQKYIDEIRPSNTIYIAFDGVAPLAKMKQQRNRRYQAAFLEKHGIVPKNLFNSCQILPGTEFMEFLSKYVNKHFEKNAKVIVSASDERGEGEHKLFQYIRENPEKHLGQNTVIYGLDADLLMLSIFNNKASNFFVYREAPEFAKSLNAELENGASYILDINLLCDSILVEIGCKYPHPDRIYDYAFLCFMLGNDFLPHLPALNIRTNGINHLLTAYKETLGLMKDTFIIFDKKIQWPQFKKVVDWMAKREEGWLKVEYAKRRQERVNLKGDKESMMMSAPRIYREAEEYINVNEAGWRERYYKVAGMSKEENTEYVCGLCWVYKYYVGLSVDVSWKSEKSSGPLLWDVGSSVGFEKSVGVGFEKSVGVGFEMSAKKQLAYVLPVENSKYKFEWSFCKYLWEGHVIVDE